MAGGFAPIKDCSKTLVYRLARYRNSLGEVIPERVITRPPSAELRADQKDSDSLPDYGVLDPILEAFIEEDLSVDEIAERGFDERSIWRLSWGGRSRFDPIWDMVLEGSTGYSGSFARQLTLNVQSVWESHSLELLQALEQAATEGGCLLYTSDAADE